MYAEIFKIAQFGIMSVYARKHYKPTYIVIREPDGRILEEFRKKQSALNWAKGNKNG